MSFEAVLWATNDAPIANVNEFAVLMMLAEKADPDGCNAFPSRSTVAARTTVDSKTVLRALQSMEGRGLIAEGDQRAAEYIRADRRPVVYDLLIPYSWFPNIDRINKERQERGRPPLTRSTRPDIAPAPEKKQRSDKGKKRPKEQASDQHESSRGDFESPRDSDGYGVTLSPPRGDYKSATGGLQVTRTSPVTQPANPNNTSRPSVREAEVARASGSDTEGRTDSGVGVIEDQEDPAAQPRREATPGEVFLNRIGRHHPEIGAGLAQGTTLADQGRLVDGLLLSGVSREEIRAVLVDRPYPAPAERKRSMAALIAARLTRIVPPLGLEAVRQVPAQAPAPDAGRPAPSMELHITRRPECPKCGLDSPGGDLCGACQGWPLCEGGCKRRVREGGLCPSCAVVPPQDDDADHVGTCPGFDGQRCGRAVATEGLCPRCRVRAAAAKKTRDAQWAAQVAAVTAMTDEEREAATRAPTPF